MKSILLLLVFIHSNVESSQCGLRSYCTVSNPAHIIITVVALSSNPTPAISCSSQPSSWQVIPVEDDSIVLLSRIQLPVNQSSSFIQDGVSLSVRNVNGTYEGIYMCLSQTGDDLGLVPPTCIIVQGRALFASCMDDCSETETIYGVVGGDVTLDTRVTFSDGGSCGNQLLDRLRILRDDSPLFICTNFTDIQASELCPNNGSVVVVPSEPMDHKYDFRIVFKNVDVSDGGLYTVEARLRVTGRTFTRMIDVSVTSNQIQPTSIIGASSIASSSPSSVPSPSPTSETAPVRGGVDGGLIAGCFFGAVIIITLSLVFIIAIPLLLFQNRYRPSTIQESENEPETAPYVNVQQVIPSRIIAMKPKSELSQLELQTPDASRAFSFSDSTLNSQIKNV